MLSKARIKFIKSLQLKKYRKQEQCFVVEGRKSVLELLKSDFEVVEVLATAAFLEEQRSALQSFKGSVLEVQPADLTAMGEYSTNDSVVAVARIKPNQAPVVPNDEFVLLLDDIRDPGNLGTIIRTADWYGVKSIIASPETADVYNSKVISASMGSFTRTRVYYTDLSGWLTDTTLPVFGTFLDGSDVHETSFGAGGAIVIGNEANGISTEISAFVTHRITIPRYGHAESLNAAISTAIVLDNLRRR